MKNRFTTIYYYIIPLKCQKISSVEIHHLSLAGFREQFHALWMQVGMAISLTNSELSGSC